MAIKRDYQAPNFQVRDTREFSGQRIVDVDARPVLPHQVGDDTWRDKMLEGMMSQGAQVLNKMADQEFNNLYLEGQAQAGIIESEDELQGNPLTRDWKVAGYRDTMGKLALADTEAQFVADLPLLREKNPEDLQKYLSERRAKLTPALGSMSREARAAAAGQLLLQDRAATKQWTTEHTKFIIDQKAQAVHTQWNTHMRVLSAAQLNAATEGGKESDYQEQLRSTSGMVVGSVWMDGSLPGQVKQKLTFEMLQSALANDQVGLYDYLQANAIPDGKGGSSTLVARLEGDQQLKLSNAYREAMSRTSDARNLFRLEQVANFEAQVDAGTFSGTYADVKGMLDPMVLNKTITGERRATLLNKYLDKQYKQEQNSVLAGAVLTGDINAIFNSGKSIDDGVKALDAVLAKQKASPEQRLNTWLQVGTNGMDEGFKKAGEMIGVTLRQMVSSKDGTILPQHVETFRTVNRAVRAAEDAGLANTRVRLLSGLGEEDRLFAEQIMRRVDSGASIEEAVQRAKDVQAQDEGLSPAARAARASGSNAALSKAIDGVEPRGVLGTVSTWVKAAFGSADAAADMKLRPSSFMTDRDHWFDHSPTVHFYTEQVRQSLRTEADNVLLTRPSATPEEALSVAKANVAARTLSTSQGPIVLPRNINLQETFGVGPGNQAAIGKAIDGMLRETVEDSRWQVAFAQGRLHAQEFDKDGKRVGNGMFIEPQNIRARIMEDTAKEVKVADEQFGAGKTVNKGGLEIKYNGMNTAGVPVGWMHGFRTNLIVHEGVRDTPYEDLSGAKDKAGNRIMTAGVGVSSHNPRYPKVGPDGKVSSEEATRSFNEASNDAAQAGAAVSRALGVQNQYSFMLMSELAYQSGTAFMEQSNKTGDRYRVFGEALKSGDVAAAQEAFKGTAAWYYSRDPKNPEKVTGRQKNYLKLIEKSLKG